jgi:hypothetical protein
MSAKRPDPGGSEVDRISRFGGMPRACRPQPRHVVAHGEPSAAATSGAVSVGAVVQQRVSNLPPDLHRCTPERIGSPLLRIVGKVCRG